MRTEAGQTRNPPAGPGVADRRPPPQTLALRLGQDVTAPGSADAPDPVPVIGLLRIGFGISIITVILLITQSFWANAEEASLALPYEMLELAALMLAGALSLRAEFAHYWRSATLSFCLFVVGVGTRSYAMLGQQVPVFVTILVVLTATCALVPWELEWQAGAIAGLMIAAVADTLLVRPHSPYIAELWLAVLTSSVLTLTGNKQWARWRNALFETNRKLRESEARQRKLLDANLDPVSLTRLSDHRYIYVNDAFLKRGYTREQVLGRSVEELNIADPVSLAAMEAELTSKGFVRNFESNIRMPDGRLAPHLISCVLVDLDGEPCVLSFPRDITEFKEIQNNLIAAQHQLEQSETKLRKIFEACPEAISINSLRDGRFIDVNPRFSRVGYTREQVLADSSLIANLWADPAQFYNLAGKLLSQGYAENVEVDLKNGDGSPHTCLMSAAIIELDGEPCSVTFSSDISELKRAQHELIAAREAALAASRAKSEFLSSMSHEIRTPMNAILGMADLLAETELTPEQRRFAATMTSNGNALLNLINGILDLAKIESGRLNLEQTDFDLEELVEHVADTLSNRACEKGLELTTRIAPDVPVRLIGDTLRLRQVLINLVGNAIKFTEQGEVSVTVGNEPGHNGDAYLRFDVRDSGIGITAEKLGYIFESFTQADSSTTRKYGGSGLGLTIATRLVQLMGGRIWATSEPGKGSTFHFVARLKAAPAEGPATTGKRPQHLQDVRILVVDDNPTSRLILEEVLAAQGAQVDQAGGGREALAQTERARGDGNPYKLILLDCRMPEMDGFQAARQLRREEGQAIILMPGSEELNQALATMREIGLEIYICKPLKRAEVLSAVALAMGRKPGAAAPPRSANGSAERVTRALKILLAEDSPDNRQLIEAYLKNLPHTLEIAENGQVAVTKFMRASYDLVLMDVQMPVMDGYTAVRKIRQWEREHGRPLTPIAALTASALEEDICNSFEAGCTAHLSKPIKKSVLLTAISDLTMAPASAAANGNGKGSGNGMKTVIETDPELAELVPGFLARKREDVAALMTAVEGLDYQALRAIGHRIKGEGTGFGFEVISEIGRELEDAARAQDAGAANRLVRALADYLDSVEVRPASNGHPHQ